MKKNNGPKILFLDIETIGMQVKVWQPNGNDFIPHDRVIKDWAIIAWAAKWKGEDKVYYKDNRKKKNIRDDKNLLKDIWKLMDKADIIITQNGRFFDVPKLNARFEIHQLGIYSSFKHLDTRKLAKKHFGFTYYSLEYMAKVLKLPHQKLKHKKYPGNELWDACELGILDAWNEMEKYNKYDVLVLEDLYNRISPWDNSINYDVYYDETNNTCGCGSTDFKLNGKKYLSSGVYNRYKCKKCGHETRGKTNLLSKEKKSSLRGK